MRYYLTEIIAFILRNCLQQHYPLTRGRVPKKGCLYFGILPNDSFYDPFSDILGASWALGAWEHLEDIFGISWGYLGISLGYLGNIFGILGGLTFNGEILKVKNLTGAPSNPIPLVKRSSEQFLFLKLGIWKALM